jgi:hypothetical protein
MVTFWWFCWENPANECHPKQKERNIFTTKWEKYLKLWLFLYLGFSAVTPEVRGLSGVKYVALFLRFWFGEMRDLRYSSEALSGFFLHFSFLQGSSLHPCFSRLHVDSLWLAMQVTAHVHGPLLASAVWACLHPRLQDNLKMSLRSSSFVLRCLSEKYSSSLCVEEVPQNYMAKISERKDWLSDIGNKSTKWHEAQDWNNEHRKIRGNPLIGTVQPVPTSGTVWT